MIPDAIDLSGLRRVLVTKLRHHGDVLLTSPVFQVLKNRAPHLEIDALVYADTAPMLEFHPAISEIFCVDRNWKKKGVVTQLRAEWRLLQSLKARRYDLIVHLTEHPRGATIKRLLRIPHGVARAVPNRMRPSWKTFSHQYRLPRGGTRHTVEQNLDALRRIGIQPDGSEKRLVFEPGEAAQDAIGKLLSLHGLETKQFIHIHPTSRWLFKCWPTERVGALIEALCARGHRIVVTCAPDEQERAMVRKILDEATTSVIDLSGRLSLKELAVVSRHAKLFIGVDSAPMHIAAAMQTPTVALFGPSSEIEWGPWMVKHKIAAMNPPCRPCGMDGCGGSKISDCLTTLPLEIVLSASEALLQE
jgi:heptosyltransferase III